MVVRETIIDIDTDLDIVRKECMKKLILITSNAISKDYAELGI